jgi:hypothetical protein
MSAYGKEPPGLFTDSLMCCDNSDFNEESPEHHASQSYKVESWIWSTEQMGPLHRFMHRTLPFGFIATNELSRELFIILRGTITSYEWKNNLINDFEAPVIEHYPRIGEIKNELYKAGAHYASMSGSGASVFGIFDKGISLDLDFEDCVVWKGN